MSLQRLSKIKGLQDPLKQFQITFTISMAPALLLAIAQQKATGILTGGDNGKTVNAEELTLRCTSFSYPTSKIIQTNLVIGSFRRKLGALQNKSGVWKCKITEQQDGGVLNTIQSWMDLIHNPMTGISCSSILYVSTCVVDIEGIKGKRRIYLKGFYPIEYSVGEIDPNSSKPLDINISFNYDWWTEVPTSISTLGL